MSRVNRVPYGLQNLLGAQNFGDNPSELSGIIAPTLDLWQMLKFEQRAWHIDPGAVNRNTPGAISFKAVPEGEMWIVEAIGCSFAKNAPWAVGDVVEVTASLNQAQGSNAPTVFHPLGSLGRFEATAAVATWWHYFSREMPQPLVLSPGEVIEWELSNTVMPASNVAYRGACRYVKLRL